jgi:hypothetical protein
MQELSMGVKLQMLRNHGNAKKFHFSIIFFADRAAQSIGVGL